MEVFLSDDIRMDIWELALPEEDYNLHEFFPKKIPYHLQPLLELRIKLILKENTTLQGGDIKVVNTCLIIGSEIKETRVSMFLLPPENIEPKFESPGYIRDKFKGRVLVKLANHSANTMKLRSGTCVGYLLMTPYSLDRSRTK